MTEAQKRMMEKLGLEETDFQPQPTEAEQIKALQEQNEALLECLLEMSEIVYA